MPATSLNATQIDSDPGGFCGLPLVPIIPLKGSPAWWLLAPRSLSPLVPDFREISAVRKTNLCFWVAQFLSTVRYFILMCLWIHHKIIFAHWMLEITCNWSKKKIKTGVGGGESRANLCRHQYPSCSAGRGEPQNTLREAAFRCRQRASC